MRMFTAITLSDEAKGKILAELRPLKGAGAPIRWVEAEHIHLTLKFIGEIEEGRVALAAEALAAARIPVAPFPLGIRGFGKFPAGGELHVLWAGVEENPSLLALFHAIEATLSPFGVAADARPFHPHITLGRCKAQGDFTELFRLLAGKSGHFIAASPVGAFQLMRSDLTPSGPIHKVIKEIPLDQS